MEDVMKIPQNYEEALRQLIQQEHTLSVDERRRIITKAKTLPCK